MTRINLVQPSELTDQHLMAEYREIVRIPINILKGNVDFSDIPEEFKLGKGHVKFFYNKIQFLSHRFRRLFEQLYHYRRFDVDERFYNYMCNIFQDLRECYPELYNEYRPSPRDIGISRNRLESKIRQKPNFYTYKGKKMFKHDCEAMYEKFSWDKQRCFTEFRFNRPYVENIVSLIGTANTNAWNYTRDFIETKSSTETHPDELPSIAEWGAVSGILFNEEEVETYRYIRDRG